MTSLSSSVFRKSSGSWLPVSFSLFSSFVLNTCLREPLQDGTSQKTKGRTSQRSHLISSVHLNIFLGHRFPPLSSRLSSAAGFSFCPTSFSSSAALIIKTRMVVYLPFKKTRGRTQLVQETPGEEDSPGRLGLFVQVAGFTEACDLLRHGSADGLLQLLQRTFCIRRLLPTRIQPIGRQGSTSGCGALRNADRVCQQQPLHTLEDGVSAAGQEGGQVRVDFGAQLSAMFPTLQLNAGGETPVSISLASDVCWMTHSSRMELISGVKNFSLDSPSDVLVA